MPTQLPPPFPEPDRDDLVAQFHRDFAFYADDPSAADEGTQADVDAKALADQLVPGYQSIKRGSDNLVVTAAEGAALAEWCRSKGIPGPQEATTSLGYVVAATAKGGTTVLEGDQLKAPGAVILEVVATTTVLNGGLVLVRSVTTGPSANLPAGTPLLWSNPRPGCLQDAVVGPDGLTGGRLEETDPEVIQRIIEIGADPPGEDGNDNDARMRRRLRDAARALGIPLQASFSYPCIHGPGTTALTFTVTPDAPGGSRIPTPAQLAAVEGWLKEQLPGDDSLFLSAIAEQSVTLALRVSWRQGAAPWADLTPWPAPYVGTGALRVTAATSATSFVVGRTGGYVGVAAPKVGQTIALYNRTARAFVRKRIAAVGGAGPWTLTIDATANVSDTTYTPVVDQRVSPWSDSLQLLVAPLLAEFGRLGPGEQVGVPFDEGRRQRRAPRSELLWPSRLGNRVVNPVQDLAATLDGQLFDPAPGSLPQQVTLGVPGTLSWLFVLGDLAVYPL